MITISRIILLFFCFCSFDLSFGQSNEYQTAKVIPPSPTAAALGKYGDIPVSFYSGTPSISIPLYNIFTTEHNLPIQLQYDARGTKANENAPWTGLGWSLIAGGAIVRTVRGLDDFNSSYGYYYSGRLPSVFPSYSDGSISNEDFITYQSIHEGRLDAEPDILNYNFGGYSGKFVMSKQVDGSIAFQSSQDNLKIDFDSGKWIITNDKGYKYYFNTAEIVRDYTRDAGDVSEGNSINGINGLHHNPHNLAITSWYLDSIVAPNSEKIAFQYLKGKSLSLLNRSEQIYKFLSSQILVGCTGGINPIIGNETKSFSFSKQEIADVYLDKIIFSNGEIQFKKSDRLDVEFLIPGLIPGGNLSNPSKLDSIIIRNKHGVVIRKIGFKYSYFRSESLSGRLKLDEIIEVDKNGTILNPYIFTYYNPNEVPDKNTLSIDHWGFYNGKGNTVLTPSTILPLAGIPSIVGADREADMVGNYPINGVLKSIQYPTGGESFFEYELHDYSNLSGGSYYPTVNKSLSVSTYPEQVYRDTFTIKPYDPDNSVNPNPDKPVPVRFMSSYNRYDQNVSAHIGFLGFGYVMKTGANGRTYFYANTELDAEGQTIQSGQKQESLNLPPGDYIIQMIGPAGWRFFISVAFPQHSTIPVTKLYGGGIRIKTITNQDALGKEEVKTYKYLNADGKSSGKLLFKPKYFFTWNQRATGLFISNGLLRNICRYGVTFYGLYSNSVMSKGTTSTSDVIGYSRVTELLGRNGENGRTEYYFNNIEETPPFNEQYPFIPNIGKPMNGKLDSVIVFDASGNKQKVTAYSYVSKAVNSIKGVVLFAPKVLNLPGNVNDMPLVVSLYDNYSSWIVSSEEKESLFNGINKITNIKQYKYENTSHKLPTSIEIDHSDGRVLITKYKRPNDYIVSGGNSFVEQMRNLHIISPVIEEQTLIKEGSTLKLIAGNFKKFKKNGEFFKPELLYGIETTTPLTTLTESSFSGTNPIMHTNYKQLFSFNKYNTLGSILEQQKVNDVKEVYLWGYNSQYPVAKIVGTDYATAIAKVTQAQIDAATSITNNDVNVRTLLNNLRTIPGALVTTYTYEPLIGMTSQCDVNNRITYYEYDGFGRLKTIRDQDNNVIKTMDYQYQKPNNQ